MDLGIAGKWALVGGASLDEADFHRIVWFETPEG